ncbi:MAG: hypothetical protein ACM32E_19990 [Gemmatimonadota bacterium]
MARQTRPAPAAPGGLVPAAQARRRSAVMMTLALCGLTLIVVVPAAVLRLRHDASPLPIFFGVVSGFCCWLLRDSCSARKSWHVYGEGSCFLTARTWTGRRTVDLRNLRSVRGRKIVQRGKPAYRLIVRDASGVCLALSDRADIRLTRQILAEQQHRGQPSPATVSRLGAAVLGVRPAGIPLSFGWSFASVLLFVVTAWVPVVAGFLIQGGR